MWRVLRLSSAHGLAHKSSNRLLAFPKCLPFGHPTRLASNVPFEVDMNKLRAPPRASDLEKFLEEEAMPTKSKWETVTGIEPYVRPVDGHAVPEEVQDEELFTPALRYNTLNGYFRDKFLTEWPKIVQTTLSVQTEKTFESLEKLYERSFQLWQQAGRADRDTFSTPTQQLLHKSARQVLSDAFEVFLRGDTAAIKDFSVKLWATIAGTIPPRVEEVVLAERRESLEQNDAQLVAKYKTMSYSEMEEFGLASLATKFLEQNPDAKAEFEAQQAGTHKGPTKLDIYTALINSNPKRKHILRKEAKEVLLGTVKHRQMERVENAIAELRQARSQLEDALIPRIYGPVLHLNPLLRDLVTVSLAALKGADEVIRALNDAAVAPPSTEALDALLAISFNINKPNHIDTLLAYMTNLQRIPTANTLAIPILLQLKNGDASAAADALERAVRAGVDVPNAVIGLTLRGLAEKNLQARLRCAIELLMKFGYESNQFIGGELTAGSLISNVPVMLGEAHMRFLKSGTDSDTMWDLSYIADYPLVSIDLDIASQVPNLAKDSKNRWDANWPAATRHRVATEVPNDAIDRYFASKTQAILQLQPGKEQEAHLSKILGALDPNNDPREEPDQDEDHDPVDDLLNTLATDQHLANMQQQDQDQDQDLDQLHNQLGQHGNFLEDDALFEDDDSDEAWADLDDDDEFDDDTLQHTK